MKTMTIFRRYFVALSAIAAINVALTGCSDDEPAPTPNPSPDTKEFAGFYLLNEGNMGSNKATIDSYNSLTGVYSTDVYAKANPTVALQLGDGGSDLQVYGDKLYAAISNSHKVEVMDANTVKRIGQIDIDQPRYIIGHGNYIYVTSYVSPAGNQSVGSVYKIDTNTLEITSRIDAGYDPEEMAIVGNKLYVANSGGLHMDKGENTVSVIDLNTFTLTKSIPVEVNLHHLRLADNGYLYVSSRGNYAEVPSSLYVIDPATDKVIKNLNCPVADFAFNGDKALVYSVGYDASWNTTYNYYTIDLTTNTVSNDNFITDNTCIDFENPYCIAVDNETSEFYITDARNYISSGAIYCYNPDGTLKWKQTTGMIPGHIAFKPAN